MAKLIISLLLSSFYLSANSQNIKASEVSGQWVLSKHTITLNGKLVNKMDAKRISMYVFLVNGTYRLTEEEKNSSKTYITKGKWKVIANGKKIHLYNNIDAPHERGVEIADNDLIVEYLGGEYYLTYTYGDTIFPPNTDYWKRAN
ncbi:MAG TPA: hypothetical protein VN616_06920 [Puia sp.]|nr:hypothetical protein [Puia sp.]